MTEQTITTDTAFTLKVSDGKREYTANTSIMFMNYIYYGNAAEFSTETLTKELHPDKSYSLDVTAGEGEYIFFALPSRLGTPTFAVDGFEGGFVLDKTQSIQNEHEFSEEYSIYRTSNTNLGRIHVEVK